MTAASSMNDLNRTLGIVLGKLEGIESSIKRADEHRAAMHNDVSSLADTVDSLTSQLKVVEQTVADSKEVTDEVKQWKQRGIGALFVTGLASAAISSTIVGFIVYWWEAIARLLKQPV